MRRGREPKFWIGDDGKVIGIDLGADYCAEHEWGIASLRNYLGMDDEALGIEKRRIRRIEPAWLHHGGGKPKKAPVYHLVFDQWFKAEHLKDRTELYLSDYSKDPNLAAAWSGNDFGILVRGLEYGVHLLDLYNAIITMDAALWVGGGTGNPFERPGLQLFIVSRIPQELKDVMLKADEDALALEKATAAIGLDKKLKAAGKEWFALSPHWTESIGSGKGKTKYEVMFWLNPRKQDVDNFGYFTVEELLLWGKGEGPVPMTQAQLAEHRQRYGR